MGGLNVVLTIILVTIASTIGFVEATHDTNIVGIQISKSCEMLLKNNIETTCPSYESLVKIGLDSSLPGTGEFEYDDNGWLTRGDSPYKQHQRLYNYSNNHIIIDPHIEMQTRIKMIIITPMLPEFTLAGELQKVNHTRILHQDRYVEDCETATITAEKWTEFLADTIYFMRNDCEPHRTLLQTQFNYTDTVTPWDITTTKRWQHDTWLAETKEKCREICKEY